MIENFFVIFIISVAFFLQSVLGFGGGLVSVSLLSIIIGVKASVTLVLLFQLSFTVLLFSIWREVNWEFVAKIFVWLVCGVIVGIALLAKLPEKLLLWCLIIGIVLYVIRSISFPQSKIGIKNHYILAAFGGGLAGLFQGMLGTGGPPLIIAISEARLPKKEVRATLTAIFFIMNLLRVLLSSSTDLITSETLMRSAVVFPFFFAAICIGNKVHYRLKESYYRQAVIVLLSVSAISLTVKAL